MAKCGIGLAVRLAANGMFQIDDVTPNSPSQMCGYFKKGDLITAVDGKSVIGHTMDQFVQAVLGAPGSDITVAIQRKNLDDLSAAADRLSFTLQRGETKTAKELAQIQSEAERAAQIAELERRKQMTMSRPSAIISGIADVKKQGFLFKRSSSKILGSYKWQKRFFFIAGNVLYYRNLTEESGPSQFKSSNLLSGLSGDKKIVFGSNTEVLNSPFDHTQFSIASSQNESEREFVFKAANQVERQDWVEALLRCSSGDDQPVSPVKQEPVSHQSAFETDTQARQRRASLPSLVNAASSAMSSAAVHSSSDFVANFSNYNTAEFPAVKPTVTQSHASAPAAHSAAGATVVRPAGGRLELNAKKVQVQKAIGDTEGTGALLSKFAIPAGATSAWLYDPLSVGDAAALTAQFKNHARTLTCLSFSTAHTELLQPLLAAIKSLHALTHINITSQVFTKGTIQLFATAIEDTQNLSHLSLCSAHLSDDILSVLLQSLSTHRRITFLKFCDNNLTAEGFASILKALPCITGLELDDNPISSKFDTALPTIKQGLREAVALSSLSLLQTGISVNEVDEIIQSLMQMPALERLVMDVTPRDLFDVIIQKGGSNAQFRFPPSCFIESGWPQSLWYLSHSHRHGHATKRNISVCFFGPPGSGKSSLINALFSSATYPSAEIDVSCPTVGYRQYSVNFESPNVLARITDLGSQGDNVASLNFLLTCKYSLYVIVWKRPDTLDPLSEQHLLPLVSWVRAIATIAPAATFLIIATHSNTPRPAESHSAYKSAFESMLKDVKARIKLELDRIQESYSAELTELHRTIEKLKAQLVAQEIRKRKLGSPCPGTTVLDMPSVPDEVLACNKVILELQNRINDLSARSSRIAQGFTAQGMSNKSASFQVLSPLEVDSFNMSDLPFAKDAFKSALSEFLSNSYWKSESCIQFHDSISDVIAKLPAPKYTFKSCVSECHLQINQAAENYVMHSLQGTSSTKIDDPMGLLQEVAESRIFGVQCQVQQSSGDLKIFLVDCNNVTFSTFVSSKHPFVHDYLDQDTSLLIPFIQGTTGVGRASSSSQVDVTFSNGSWTVAVVRPLKLTFNLSMERSPTSRLPPTKLTVKDVTNIIHALVAYGSVCLVKETIFPSLKSFEHLFSLLVHPQPRRMAVSTVDFNSHDADFKSLEDVGILRKQLLQNISPFNSAAGMLLDPQPALDCAVALALIRKLPARNDTDIRFKSAVRHLSTPAPTVPDSTLNTAAFFAALPFPFHVSVAAVLSHLVFIRVISDVEIDSGAVVTSGRGRLLMQRGSLFCFVDAVASDALPPSPDRFSSFGSFISKDMYPCILRVQSNDLSMFSYVLEALRYTILNGPLPFVFHPFCLKPSVSSGAASWIRQCIENPFYGTSVKQWAEFNSVGDRLLNLHAQRCSFYLSCHPNDSSRRFVTALKNCMSDNFLCNVWDPHNSTPQQASALAEARHFLIALSPEYLANGACVSELLHILDLVHPSSDDPRAPVAAHQRSIAGNPTLRKTISLLLLHPAVSSSRISSIAQSRLVVVPAAAGVAEVARITDAANAALLRLVALARERADAFKKFDWFTPAINPTFTGAAAPSLDAMAVLVRSLFAAVPPQHACLPPDDISSLLNSSTAFIPAAAAASDATPQPGGFMQLYPESCSALDTVTAATLALLGLTDREICDAAESGGKETTNDLLGDVTESKVAVLPELVRAIISASGIDIAAAKAAAAAARHPPTPPEAADAVRERRESIVSNASEGSNTDSQMSSEGFRNYDGRSSPVNHPVFMIRSQTIESSAIGAPASAIAPPPAPATQRRRGSVFDI